MQKHVRDFEPVDAEIHTAESLRALPRENLPGFCDELRDDMLQIVSQTGGHLGAGLGVVELTVALHYVFETPKDKLIWDVSHQCYPHKILTGRRDAMQRVRQDGGPSGFTCRSESSHDPFGAAHSSTSISAGLGFATSRDLSSGDANVVSIIGDGAMSGGMAFEGLNNVGAQKRKMIVILNDNNMSIAPPSGALSEHLVTLRDKMPEHSVRAAHLESGPLPSFVGQPTLFDDLGVRYCGPFNGHDVEELVTVLKNARDFEDGPILIHVLTDKGRGYAPAEDAADKYHGVAKFDIETGHQHKTASLTPSYTAVFADALLHAAAKDNRVVAATAAMPSGTGLDKFANEFPDRCFDTGIAEQHAVTFCAAMAADGMRPFAAIYSTFLQRAYDQIVHDVAIQKLPVRFAIDRAGLVGADGVTHHGSYDVAYLSCLPNFVVMAAGDECELARMVATATEIDDRPCAFRYPRGNGIGVTMSQCNEPVEIGRGRIVREGTDVAVLSYGSTLQASLDAANSLETLGVSVTIADARFAKPIDDTLLARLLRDHAMVLTVEEASVGGFSTQAMDSLLRTGRTADAAKLQSLYLPDLFIDHGSQESQRDQAGLTASHIVDRVLAFKTVTR